jgi:SsrA-binding protein
VPLELFFSVKGLAKIKLGLAKGKNVADKRDALRKKDMERQTRQEMKER